MFAAIILMCALGQDAPVAKSAPDAALFEELIRKTNELHSFVADYSLRSAGKELGKIRIVYQAPDRALIEMQLGKTRTCRFQDGFMDFRGFTESGETADAHFQILGSIRERYDRLTESMLAELPDFMERWPRGGEAGVCFELQTVLGVKGSRLNFQFRGDYAYPRQVLLGWLPDLAKRSDGRLEAEGRLVFEETDGTKLMLSSTTGFIERVEKEREQGLSSMELVGLVTNQDVAASFELAPPDASAKELTDEMAADLERYWACQLRASLFRTIARVVSEKGAKWSSEWRPHARAVLEKLHADAIGRKYDTWITTVRKQNEQMEAWVRDRVSRLSEEGSPGRSEIDDAVRDRREKLEQSFARGVEERRSGLTITVSTVPDDELRKSLTDLEELAVSEAFEAVVRGPLLGDFEDRVKNAGWSD